MYPTNVDVAVFREDLIGVAHAIDGKEPSGSLSPYGKKLLARLTFLDELDRMRQPPTIDPY
jgi:hypothetical protein